MISLSNYEWVYEMLENLLWLSKFIFTFKLVKGCVQFWGQKEVILAPITRHREFLFPQRRKKKCNFKQIYTCTKEYSSYLISSYFILLSNSGLIPKNI